MNYIMLEGKKIMLNDETVKKILKQVKKETIYVPDNIIFSEIENDDSEFSMGLIFNHIQEICYNKEDKTYNVFSGEGEVKKVKLIPYNKDNLQPGDWVFSSRSKNPNFTRKDMYYLTLENNPTCSLFVYISDNKSILYVDSLVRYCWKVVKV